MDIRRTGMRVVEGGEEAGEGGPGVGVGDEEGARR